MDEHQFLLAHLLKKITEKNLYEKFRYKKRLA